MELALVKDFIVEIIQLINRPSLNDSFADLKNKTVLFSDFQERFNLYERNLKSFKIEIDQKNSAIGELEKRIEVLTAENSAYKQEQHRLNLYITELKDEHTILVKEREAAVKKPLELKINDLEATVQSLKMKIDLISETNHDLEQKNLQLKTKLAESQDLLSQISTNFVPIGQHQKLIDEKAKLEQLHVQLENSYATKCSECESLRSQIASLTLTHQNALQAKERNYALELDKLNE